MAEDHSHPPRRTFTSLFRVPAFRVYFIFSCLAMGVLAGLVYWAIPDDKDLRSALRGKKAEIKDLEKELGIKRILINIDGKVILDSDHKNALDQYSNLLSQIDDPDTEQLIKNRIEQLETVIEESKSDKTQSDRKDVLLKREREKAKRLENKADSILNTNKSRADSLLQTIDDLKLQIDKKNRLLAKKERIQVISFTNHNGSEIHYLGEVKDGKADGGGIGIWTSGSVYKGEWKDNKRHGKGTIESPNGEKYEGEWVEGQREGKGTYYWPGGERYEGEWKNNKRNGQGILYDPDSNIRFEGKWKNDKPVR